MSPESFFEFNTPPETCHADSAEACLRARWLIPADLPYLDGHFPSQPIVPGIAVIEASLALIRKEHPALVLRSVKQAKFMLPLAPNDHVEIEAKPVREKEWAVDWKKVDGDGAFLARLSLVFDR